MFYILDINVYDLIYVVFLFLTTKVPHGPRAHLCDYRTVCYKNRLMVLFF